MRDPETSTFSTAPTLAETEEVFAALAHETRRHIVAMLSHMGGELPSGYLAQKFSASWPTITRHLSVLVDAKLLDVRREGRSSFYRLDRDRIQRVVGGWLEMLQPPSPKATWRSSGKRTKG
ncbi:MAG: metalloregulator ArsR/SmtB family transcription factor [Kofleriaceae bacterium]